MAITVAMRTEITQLYVALFGRAPDSEGLGFWVNLRNQGQSLTQIANSMYATDAARPYYPTWLTNQEIIASFYENVLGRTAEAEGLAFWTAKLNATGATPGSVITQMVSFVANYTGSDPAGIESAALFNNRVTVAQHYAEEGGGVANATIVLADVTSTPATVAAAIAAIDAGTIGALPDGAKILTTGQDTLVGGAANNTFVANVVQNQLGEQVNTLGSGDSLNGGAGTDTLMAKITAGAFAGSSAGGETMPIQPMTSGIETVKLEAVNSGIGGGANTNVFVNAKDMLGVNTIGSWHSDANLVIQNMTTQDNNGVGRVLNEMTVLMGYTGNDDSAWNASDLSVYFDQDYLNPATSFTRPSVDIRLMNEDKYDVDFAAGLRGTAIQALAGVYVEKLVITVNGVGYSLASFIGELGAPNSNPKTDFIKTYPELLAAVQAAVVALKAANPGNAALQTLTATDGGEFLADISPVSGLRRVGESVTLSIEGSTNGVPNTLIVQAQDLVLDPIQTTPIPNSNRFERAQDTPAVPSTELSINIELEKVGLAGDGGRLIVGSMFKDSTNTFNDLYDGKGIAVFDVTVSGGSDKPSSLSGMHSTGNNLREVNVTTNAAQTGNYAALTIGNSQTPGLASFATNARVGDVITPIAANANAMKDVQTFNAAGLKGDLTLFAALTSEVTAKYMTLVDAAPAAPAADNVQFTYTGGTGNDYINLWLDAANLAAAGTTTREDFVLTINGGAGNDEIVTRIGNGLSDVDGPFGADGDTLSDNWYINSKINANLTINAGDGNDTVRTLGAGDFVINANAGNDTVYADNTGGRAVYVFNVADGNALAFGAQYDINNLQSQTAATSVMGVNANLTVTFKGITSTAVIANSAGALANVAINDLSVNQAIKAAINLDPVLSKLLLAEDGPGRTLVVRSLIDGADFAPADLSIAFGNTGALSAGQIAIGGLVLFAPTAAITDGYLTTNFAQSPAGVAAVAGVAEVFTATFGATVDADTVTFDGVAVALTAGQTGTQNAAEFAADYTAAVGETWTAVATGNTVTFTKNTTGAQPDVTTADFVVTSGGAGADITVTAAPPTVQGVTAVVGVNELIGFNSMSASDNVITGGTGNDVMVLGTTAAPAAMEASNDTVRYEAGAFGNDTVVNFGANTVLDTGAAAVAEVFTATFGATVDADTVTFDGIAVALTAGQTGIQNAAEFAADYTAAAGETWSAVASGTTVTFTKLVPGPVVDVVTADFVVTSGGAGADITVTAAAPTTQGAAAIAPMNDADLFDFRGLGGDITTQVDLVTPNAVDKSILVVAETAANDTAAEIKGLMDASAVDNLTASTHVYVAYDTVTNIADVYTVADGAADNDTVVTLMGTIDLADTPWASLTLANFV